MATPIAHKGVVAGAKVQAMTLLDLIMQPTLVAEAKSYFTTVQTKTTKYYPLMAPSDQPAIWLNADMLAPYDYWQFWRNTEDADVGRFLKLFTDLPLEDIARLEALTGSGINEAKKVLATEATAMLHGTEAAASAEEAARVAFEAGGLSSDMPTLALKASDLAAMSHAGLMVAVGFAASNSEARKQIANGGFRIQGEKVSDPAAFTELPPGEAELRSGKRRVRLVVEP
jgi:tyrosyl-tRNA synthetase